MDAELDSDPWQNAVEVLQQAKRVVVFTGAGISAGSGIPTFRDESGFWQIYPPEKFANWKGILETAILEPALLAEFLVAVIEPIAHARPNVAYLAIAELENKRSVTVITQNIDGLHQEAGSTVVHEIHGTLLEVIRGRTGKVIRRVSREDLHAIVSRLKELNSGWQAWKLPGAISSLLGIDWEGTYRPNLVLFGDALAEPAWPLSLDAVTDCDVLLAVGTSGLVYPAATLPERAWSHGAKIITVDPVTGGDSIWLRGHAEEILPKLVHEVGE